MRRFLFRLMLVGAAIVAAAPQALSAKRLALVIGNDAYRQVTGLKKAVNDARAIGETLESIGFRVLRAENLSRRGMNRQIQLFASQLGIGDEALFFFAGHGVEINGRNYLLPIDIPKVAPGQEGFVTTEAIAVDSVLDRIRERGTRVSILVLDACRDNPFPRSGTRSLGGTRGLARMPAPEGTFIMYSAGVGQTALDRLGERDPNPNSVFTRSLLPLLKRPGLSLTATARQVRRDVRKLARSVSHDQRPAYYDEVTGDVFLAGRADGPAARPAAGLGPAAQAWSLIKDTKVAGDLEAFVRRFPNSFYADLARSRLAALKRKPVAVLPPPKPVLPSDAERAEAPAHACDRLAAHPGDPLKAADGVAFASLRAREATRACRQAVGAHPAVARFAYQLGRALSKGGSSEEAVRWYRQAAEKGHAGAMNSLGVRYAKGQGVGEDQREAVRWYRKAAEKDNVKAMNNLGIRYERGKGIAKDEREAVRWYRKAAEKGHAGATYNLGVMYARGQGVGKDEREAVRLYREAAAKGHGKAMYNLGVRYDRGNGVAKDASEAVRWYRKAAEKDNVKAMNNLGVMYARGEGVDKDQREAVRLYRRAAEKGHDTSMYNLAERYRTSKGVAKDEREAARWYRKAAEKGHAKAKYRLGLALDGGKGVARDPKAAAGYVFEALRAGYDLAVEQMSGKADARSEPFRRELQRLMKRQGVYAGPVDGSFGPGTRRAVEALAGR